jgi:hypothetical protein
VSVAKYETQVVATIPAGKEQVFVQLNANADIGMAPLSFLSMKQALT